MRSASVILVAAALFAYPSETIAVQGSSASTLFSSDVANASDHPLTGRYRDSVILAQTVKAFDEIVLPSGPSTGPRYSKDKRFTSTVKAQGQVTRTIYIAPAGRSSLEVTQNFVETVTAKGFTPAYRCATTACGESFVGLKYDRLRPETKVVGPNYEHLRALMVDAVFSSLIDVRYSLFKKSGPEGDSHVALFAGVHRGGSYGAYSTALSDRVGILVEVVEPRVMDRRMDVVSAASITDKLASDGRAVFYGIFFDVDKADLKPESEPQLAEMAKYLTVNPRALAFIVGHTDTQGAVDYNLGLSTRRAEAVVQALVSRYRINTERLTARGLGPLSPVATNHTEEGRARNRRVEMVER